ncbi:Zinc finger C3HC4 RING-type [Arabidopsis suecica]|nr:Zinc finger C3HC4 RING-type [Arabidopsis suecica]
MTTTAETGQSSGSKPSDDDAWAKLVPLDTRFSDIEIRCSDMIICSEIKPSSLEKHEWCRITKNLGQSSATLHNQSSDAILVDKAVVPKDGAVDIISGSEIVPGPEEQGYLQYRFTIMPAPESRTQLLQISIDPEHAKCSICLNIWHDVVTAAPCLHNFCNGCFSEWMRRSEEKHKHVLCPQCRTTVQYVGKNHFLKNIQEDILKVDAALRRPAEDIAVLDSSASIQSNLIIGSKRKRRLNMPAPTHEERDSLRLQCPQCVANIGGYRCEHHGAHLQCHLCQGMMPFRANLQVPLHCKGCDRPFCGAYWSSENVTQGVSGPVCVRETFRPISERTITRIPFITHEMNRHEQDITQRCIAHMEKTVPDVVAEWLRLFNNREIDRSRMPLNHAEMITASTHVCNDCYDKLVGFLLYWFRITLPRNHLPADVAAREDCWYGYACRTQHHNEDHARKRNHVCRPTRGNHHF